MARDIKEILREVLDRTDEEERSDALEQRLRALEEREASGGTITTAQIIAALEQASDEELEALHGTVVDRLAREVEERREAAAESEGEQEGEGGEGEGGEDEGESEGEPVPTRPGRKQGNAYNWTTDEEGNIVQLDVARIWGEPDEPDEVPLPAGAGEEES